MTPATFGVMGIMAGAAHRLLRLHRFRRRRDDGRGGQEPAARPAPRHPRLARHLHDALRRRHARHHRHGELQGHRPQGRPGDRVQPVGKDGYATLISAGAVAGLTTVVMTLIIGATRVTFAMSRDRLHPGRPGPDQPEDGHAGQAHAHHRHRRGPHRLADPHRQARGDGQHRHADRLHARLARRPDPAQAPPRPQALVQGAGQPGACRGCPRPPASTWCSTCRSRRGSGSSSGWCSASSSTSSTRASTASWRRARRRQAAEAPRRSSANADPQPSHRSSPPVTSRAGCRLSRGPVAGGRADRPETDRWSGSHWHGQSAQAGALEAVVEARALRLGFGCAAGLGAQPRRSSRPTRRSSRSPLTVGWSTGTPPRPRRAAREGRCSNQPRASGVPRRGWTRSEGASWGGRTSRWPGEAPVRVVAQDVDRDGRDLAAGAVEDGEPKAGHARMTPTASPCRPCVTPDSSRPIVALDTPISSASSRWLRSADVAARARCSAHRRRSRLDTVRVTRLCRLCGTLPAPSRSWPPPPSCRRCWQGPADTPTFARSQPAPQTGARSDTQAPRQPIPRLGTCSRKRSRSRGGGAESSSRRRPAQRALMMSSTRSLASPKSMAELSRKKSGFCTPA